MYVTITASYAHSHVPYLLGTFLMRHLPHSGDAVHLSMGSKALLLTVDYRVIEATETTIEIETHKSPLLMTSVWEESLSVFSDLIENEIIQPFGGLVAESEPTHEKPIRNAWREKAQQATVT